MFHCEVLTNKQISYTHILLRGTCFQNVLRPYFTIIVTSQKKIILTSIVLSTTTINVKVQYLKMDFKTGDTCLTQYQMSV